MPRRHRPVPSACLSSRRKRPHAPADDRAWAPSAGEDTPPVSSCESRNPDAAAAPAVLGSCFRRSSRCREDGTGCRAPLCNPRRVPAKAGTQRQPQRPPSWAPAFRRSSRCGESGTGGRPPACWDDVSTLPSSCESRNPAPATAPAILGSCFRRSSRCGERSFALLPPVMLNGFQHPSCRPAPTMREEERTPKQAHGDGVSSVRTCPAHAR